MLAEVRELLDEKKFGQIRSMLTDVEPADIALLFEQFPPEDFTVLFRILPKELAAECFVEMDTNVQRSLIENFTDAELEYVVDKLFMDDTVDIIEEMPSNVVKRILSHASSEKRVMINQLLHYEKDSAGTIMTTEFVELREDMSVSDAYRSIRMTGVKRETVYTCYVTDESRHLAGVVTVKDMLLADSDDVSIAELMETSIISATTDDDKEQIAHMFDKYDFLAIPIVDKENRLVGIVTFDDAMDVLKAEDTEDIQIMAAISPTDKPYLKTGVCETWLKRIPWLLLLMVSATFTSKILMHFEDKLQSMVILTAFIPMLMDTGGNAGGQSSVTIIRSLSLGEVAFKNIFSVIWKELRVSFMCGATLAVVNFGKMMLFDTKNLQVAFVVSLTLACAVVVAKLVGCMMPILAKKVGFDPAVMASPFITTIVDALSLLIYIAIACSVLKL